MNPKKPVELPQRTLDLLNTAQDVAKEQTIERPDFVRGLRLGTSAFTAAGWAGSFYPAELKPRDYFAYHASKFDTVEVDSTFYRTPSRSAVNGWYERTPSDT